MKKRSQLIRRMGFIKDQEGIMNRYLRESSQWKIHLEKTRNFISNSFAHTEAGMRQVELIEADLSGGAIEKIWQYSRENLSSTQDELVLDHIPLDPPLAHIQADAFISVNLLNQLDIILCDYILKQKPFQQEALTPFRAAIQAFHLDWISKKPACLVSDILEEVVDKNGVKSSKALLYTHLPEGIRQDRWWWDFDSMGTYHPGSRTRMEVQALEWS